MADLNKAREGLHKMISEVMERGKRAVPRYAEDVPILHEGAGPLAGTVDDLPLEPPHIGRGEIPITADSPEMAQRVRKFMAERTVEGQPSQMAKEFAEEARPEAVKRLRAEASDSDATAVIPNAGFVERASKAASYPQKKLLGFIAKKLELGGPEKEPSEAAGDIAERVADRLGVPAEGLSGILARTGLATATEFGVDPLNFLPVGKAAKYLGMGAKAVKGAEMAQKASNVLGEGKKLAQESLEAIARRARADKAMEVLKLGKKKTLSTAEKLAQQGAERIVPRNIVPAGE